METLAILKLEFLLPLTAQTLDAAVRLADEETRQRLSRYLAALAGGVTGFGHFGY